MHTATEHLLQYFEYSHLREDLQNVAQPFHGLAHLVANDLRGPEATACLRKLLEAKDCAVRAAL